jgi:antitoxin (DNA-binding transcriptional repressor) of toxin-antitoxin stability system
VGWFSLRPAVQPFLIDTGKWSFIFLNMTIKVTVFKSQCLELLRTLEKDGKPIEITRHGKTIARVLPALKQVNKATKPWQRLRGTGEMLASPGESFLSESDFEANQ